jgi:hypothetical protein
MVMRKLRGVGTSPSPAKTGPAIQATIANKSRDMAIRFITYLHILGRHFT